MASSLYGRHSTSFHSTGQSATILQYPYCWLHTIQYAQGNVPHWRSLDTSMTSFLPSFYLSFLLFPLNQRCSGLVFFYFLILLLGFPGEDSFVRSWCFQAGGDGAEPRSRGVALAQRLLSSAPCPSNFLFHSWANRKPASCHRLLPLLLLHCDVVAVVFVSILID